MKVKPELYAQMKEAISKALPKMPTAAQYAARDPVIPRIASAKDTNKRFRWDALYCAVPSTWISDNLYSAGCDDNHIDTALRSIIKELTAVATSERETQAPTTEQFGTTTDCDECENPIPDSEPSEVNSYHKPECSLYPDDYHELLRE